MDSEQTIAYRLILGTLYSQEQDYVKARAVYLDALARSEEATDRLAAARQARAVLMTSAVMRKRGQFAAADSLVRH